MTEATEVRADESVARYVDFWNSTPETQRRSGAETFAADVVYVAPAGVLTGVDALAAFTEQFVGNVGAYTFRTRRAPDLHHDRARVPWELVVGEEIFAEGTDLLVVDGDGRIASVTTFVDRAPEQRPHH